MSTFDLVAIGFIGGCLFMGLVVWSVAIQAFKSVLTEVEPSDLEVWQKAQRQKKET